MPVASVAAALFNCWLKLTGPTKPLEYNPGHSSLRLHPLKGKFQGKHAVSLAYSYRIVLILTLQNQEIILLDIGSHDTVYR